MKSLSIALSLVTCFTSFACATTPVDSRSERVEANTVPLATLGQTSTEGQAPGGNNSDSTAVIYQPRNVAVEQMRVACHDSYEILEEGPSTAEVGVALPVGPTSPEESRWFVRYRCNSQLPR